MREIDSLDELKKIELDIMKKIHDFCEKENIEYFLGYGTLIGAVRHKGFIPWDDDIDIFMTRKNYDLFFEKFDKLGVDQNLALASNKTKPHMCRAFAKVCDLRTVQYEPKYKDKEPRGVFVDIWPLDGYPQGKFARFFHKQILTLDFVMLMGSLTNIEYIPKSEKLKRMLIKLFAKVNSEKLLNKFDKRMKKYSFEESEYVFCASTKPEYYKKDWFRDKVLMDFEDAKFWVPVGYDEYLRCRYGDYMKLPPKELQKPHHVIDTYWLDEE